MENYHLNNPQLQNGAYGSMQKEESPDYISNQYMSPNDKKYLDYSIKELRTEIKRMFDNLKDVHIKTNEYINNKNNILKHYRSNSTNYITRQRINEKQTLDEKDNNNLRYNEYAYRNKIRNNDLNIINYDSNNNNYYNKEYNGNSFRNQNNYIIKYNKYKNSIINQKPGTNKVLSLLNGIPKNDTRITPNIHSKEKSNMKYSTYSLSKSTK